MKFQQNKIEDILTIETSGDLLAEDARELDVVLRDLLEGGVKKIVLDLTRTEVIASLGLGVILANLVQFRKRHGEILLAGVSNFVRKSLKITRCDSVIKSFTTVPEALSEFQLKPAESK